MDLEESAKLLWNIFGGKPFYLALGYGIATTILGIYLEKRELRKKVAIISRGLMGSVHEEIERRRNYQEKEFYPDDF